MSATHDSDYKLFFSHPQMVQELLRDWAPGDWTDEADFSTLEQVNGSYVSDDQRQRHDDMVWRLRLKDRWLWVYLVLEFQSEPDPWMALRMLVYLGLLSRRKSGTSKIAEIEHINDLLEDDTMLAERMESWFDEAKQRGIQQGMLKGQANILSKQLRLRFGVLPPEAVERLSWATQAELDAWGEAILSAPTLAAVFETTRR